MNVRTLSMAAVLLLAPLAAAEAAPRPAAEPAALAAIPAETMPPEAYTAYRGHNRHRRRHADRGARPWWLVTHPRWPGCYDRYPFYCATPEYRHHPRAVLSVRG